MKKILLVLALIVSLVKPTGGQLCPTGDLDGDCRVDAQDLEILAHQWLASSATSANLDGTNGVNLTDFALLAENWLTNYAQITLVINEFMAKNDGSVLDPYGDYDDWIEIYNYGNDAVDIGGMYLADNLTSAGRWRIPDTNPSLTTISSHGYLLIWADEEASEGILHADFKLSAGGEQIGLYDGGGNLIDSITFGPQNGNESYGRLPDGSDNWRVFASSTPGASNTAGPVEVIINEIMYHPYHALNTPENIGQEYIELFNRGAESVNLSGWRLSDGVDFTFPQLILGAGQYLVVAADVNAFIAKYPGVSNVVGGWVGRLSNSGEAIELVDAAGVRMDYVRYADEGDWSVRQLGPVDHGHRGWLWSDEHDGGGKSLELINPVLPNEYGQNWAASKADNETPGRGNSVAANDVAPLILDVAHSPIIPGPNDAVTVTARTIDEQTAGLSLTLNCRVDSQPAFAKLSMFDDGRHGDGDSGDRVYGAEIPAQPDGTVIEFYIEAVDAGSSVRTWPAPAVVDGVSQQVTNALYQVDSSFDPDADWAPDSEPIYCLVMTEKERAELALIGSRSNGEEDSDAQMNGTFISVDGTGMELRYNVGIRNRGHGTRTGPPNNYHVNFPHSRAWKDVSAVNFNCRYTHAQIIGSAIFRMAGLVAADTIPVQLRINGVNLAYTGSPMYGVYARLEAFNNDFADKHFPDDPNGNLYTCFRTDGGREADLRYEGADPNTYRDRYFKANNEAQDDWSDLIGMLEVLNNAPDATYLQEVSRVINVPQWLRYIALDSLLMNYETGLNRGMGDDYFMYCGTADPRFVLTPHDLDTILDQGNSRGDIDQSILSIATGVAGANGVDGLRRFFNHPDVVPLYYQMFLDLINGFFNPEVLDPLFDQVLGGFTPQDRINAMKQFVRQRTAAVLAQVSQTLTTSSNLPVISGYAHTTTSVFAVSGTADAAGTRSVLVNGRLAEWSPVDGRWDFGGAGGIVQTLVSGGSVWKYLDDGSNQLTAAEGASWFGHPDYDDSLWQQGAAQLGYGDDDEATVINGGPSGDRFTTTYFRRSFNVTDTARFASLHLALLRDDGAIVYLNGTEVARSNMPDEMIDYLTPASNGVSGADEDTFFDFTVDPKLLREGANVLAVEVHQDSPTSSDISFDLELAGIRPSGGAGELQPGINRIIVQAFDGPSGSGSELDHGYIDIWYDTGSTNDYPKAAGGGLMPLLTGITTPRLIVRDSYLPGIPVLVRVEVLNDDGTVNRDLWDTVATLSVHDNPSINLSANQVRLYNGLGSAQVTITGGGDFTLTLQVNGLQTSARLIDWSALPMNTVSGGLGTSQTWSGIYHITGGDFAIPAGVTLTLDPGTLVLIDGVPSGDNGTDIDVAGSIQSLGTVTSPVTFTAYTTGENWGELHHVNAEPSTFRYTSITQAGRSPAVGHSNSGPAIRASNSTFVFEHCSLTDNAGKIMQATSGCNLTFRNCLFARSIMGPEIAGTALLFEDGWITDMHGPDDADGIYVHGQQAGQLCTLSGGVAANTDDDGIDTLGSEVTIEDFMVRDCKDKGISIYGGDVDIKHCLIVENNRAPEDPTVATIATKTLEGATAVVNIDRTTIVTSKVPGYVDIGIQSHNKYGVSSGTIIYHVTNSIIDATNPVDVQAPYIESDIHISYCDVFGEAWPGVGNIGADPLFVDPANHDYQLQTGSPCVDAGDPAAQPDPDRTATDQGYYRLDQRPNDPPQGSLTENTIWKAEEGPYRITGELTVPATVTLTIMPGTSVFFEPGAKMTILGRLIAEGTQYELIRFTRTPGASDTWDGLQFVNTMSDNRIVYAVVEYGRTDDGMIGLENSNLLLDHVTLDHTTLRRIRTVDSSLIVRHSVFTDTCAPGEVPTDNRTEHIWGGDIPAGGQLIIEGNVFGATPGHNDAIDFDGASRPNPIPQILDNVFLGGGDDALDMETDAHIEGNVFMNYVKDQYNKASGESNGISAGGGREYTMVRNVFYSVQHVAQVKDDAFLTFVNNTVVGVSGAAIYFDLRLPGRSPGRGAYVDGSIFSGAPSVFEGVTDLVDLTVNRSLIPSLWHSFGQGNIDADPLFVDEQGDWHLKPDSPAIGAGSCGLDIGAYIPSGAAICGEPGQITYRTSAALTVGGPGITRYKYSLNNPNGPRSQERPVSEPIVLAGLANRQSYTVYALGKNSAGVWQGTPTASRTWTVDTSYSRLVINEVLAVNQSAVDHEGTFGDLIELFYDGPGSLNLSGMSISDDPAEPRKFVFPAGVTMNPGRYLVLYADANATTSGIHLGFALDKDGDGLYLYDRAGVLLDSVEFGLQLPNLSIGRIGYDGEWHLTVPTFGQANVAQPLGDPDRLKINEWFTNGEVLFEDDFIELYNPHAFPVELAGLYLTDNPVTQAAKCQIGPLNFIAGSGFAVFTADNSNSPGHVNFRLSADGEMIALSDGRVGFSPPISGWWGEPHPTEIDKVLYGPQTTDVSQGRAPDGAKTFQFFVVPTPGVANPASTTANTTLVAESATKRVLVPTGDIGDLWKAAGDVNDLGWAVCSGSPGGVGYERSSGYESYITLDVEGQMYNHNASCYIRVPFSADNGLSQFTKMTLRVRYDDGFVAYLNGEEVARPNFTGTPRWNSAASQTHSDAEAVLFEDIDISGHIGALRPGSNILAIQGLNTPVGGSDFLISVELVATVTGSQDQFIGRALALLDGLRVTELMYHAAQSSNYDFIELQNVGDVTLDLTGARFAEGIEFTFPQMQLAPGEFVVVVGNLAAFRSVYGTSVNIAGQYSGNLSNGGEDIVLQLAWPLEAAIMRFSYSDQWYPAADGGGQSLAIVHPLADVVTWSQADSWQPADPTPGRP
jgi:hypothetical protein